MLTVILLSAAMSIDAAGLGISLGVRSIKLDRTATLITCMTGFVIISLASAAGSGLYMLLPEKYGHLISGIILIAMGLWIIVQSGKKPDTSQSRTVNIIRSPYESDPDRSGSIDAAEAFFLGTALSLDSIGICIGAGSIPYCFLLPAAAMLMQLAFMSAGIKLGRLIGKDTDTGVCTLLSGTIIVLIGIFNIV